MTTQDPKSSNNLADLFPGQTPEWYAEAEANCDAYLEVIIRIHSRVSADPGTYAKFRSELKRQRKANVSK
jgi:hypothetical protein